MMKELYIHAGLHKTGTTYIQESLKRHEKLLSKNGILFPNYMRGISGTHHLLSHNMWTKIDEFLELVKKANEEIVLVSAEDFSHRLLNKQYLDLLNKKIPSDISVKIILYLRRQDELKESVFSEKVKHDYQGSIYDETHYVYNFKKRIDLIRKHFPKANLIIRPYEPALWVENNVYLDLLCCINPKFKTFPLIKLEKKNVGGNRRLSLFLSQTDNNLKTYKNVSELIKADVIENDGVKYVTDPEWRKNFLKSYSESNKLVAEEYPVLSEMFNVKKLKEENWYPASEITKAEYEAAMKILNE